MPKKKITETRGYGIKTVMKYVYKFLLNLLTLFNIKGYSMRISSKVVQKCYNKIEFEIQHYLQDLP